MLLNYHSTFLLPGNFGYLPELSKFSLLENGKGNISFIGLLNGFKLKIDCYSPLNLVVGTDK